MGLYLNPPEHAPMLCVDEKSQVQALQRTQPVLPMGLGYVEVLETCEPVFVQALITQSAIERFHVRVLFSACQARWDLDLHAR